MDLQLGFSCWRVCRICFYRIHVALRTVICCAPVVELLGDYCPLVCTEGFDNCDDVEKSVNVTFTVVWGSGS